MRIDPKLFILIHVALSLFAILAGCIALGGILAGTPMRRWTLSFLALSALTNLTGYGFPFVELAPAHIIGAISLILVGATLKANPAGKAYRALLLTNLYLNVLVLFAQMFQKIPALRVLKESTDSNAYAVTQTVVLLAFALTGWCVLQRQRA